MTANITPLRRWFRFRLRTLFVVLTVFCLWIGWEFDSVRKRAYVLREATAGGGKAFSKPAWCQFTAPAPTQIVEFPVWRKWRTWFGDQALGMLVLSNTTTDSEFERARRAFPEADICVGEVYGTIQLAAGPEWPDEFARRRASLVKSFQATRR